MQRNSRRNRRGLTAINMDATAIILMGFFISNAIIGSIAIPRPLGNSQDNDESFRRNYAAAYGAPLLTPLIEDVILEPKTNYSIRCEANEPTEWKIPIDVLYDVRTFDTFDPQRPFGSEIFLEDISFLNVGPYYCIKKSKATENMDEKTVIELVNNNDASTIYIYVNDPENLLAPVSSSLIVAYQYEDVIVPCKPTTPSVEVLLTTPHDTYSSEHAGRYNPKLGFVIEIRGVTDSGEYQCRPSKPSLANEEEEYSYNIHFVGNEYTIPRTKFLEKPNITSESHGHVYEGERFIINCNEKIAHDITAIATWKIPSGVDEERVNKTNAHIISRTATHTIIRSSLIVENARKADSGLYDCKITDSSKNEAHNNYLMTVLGKGEGYINISEPNGFYKVNGGANKPVTINVRYRGYPEPTLRWYKPDHSEIQPSNDYIIDSTDSSITLKISNAKMDDSGVYVIEANNSIVRKSLNFTVSISDAPKAVVKNVYVQAGELAHIECRVLSNPIASVSWIFEPCAIKPRWPSCDSNKFQKLNSTRAKVPGNGSIEHLHYLDFTPQSPGIIKCIAGNKKGTTDAKAHIFIADITENMTVHGIDENKKIARGDEVTITCAALAYYFSGDLAWYKNGYVVTNTPDIEITDFNSDYSYRKSIKFKNIRDSDSASYECRASHVSDYVYEKKSLNIFVHAPLAPKLTYTNWNSSTTISRKLGDTLELECKSEAIPIANVNWYKDDQDINTNANTTYLSEDNTKLIIPFMKPEDQGVYKCIVSNRLATVESSVTVEITDLPGLALGWIVGIISLLALLVLLIIYLYIRVNRERKLLRELKASGLANFEEGAVEHINPALSLDEQADLLPYDPKFEFPREKLKMGKQLGAGAFGVVLKAHAQGIKTDEKETVVAVKMVKRTADNEVMRALVSELKIMVHLGQHLNVVNLLGAVTKNILQRELMVIVEYCRYGNVQNFLLRNRKRFINQINPETDRIDPTIITQRFSDNFELNRNSSDNDPRSGTRAGRPNSSGYLQQSDLYEGHVDSCATEHTVMTTIPEDDDNVLSNNSVQPAWRSNYKPDSTEAMTVTTSDLVSWAFQVARGMDYLSSKKVLHGDLAARNILLCEDNIVKICDFGLARTMYRNDNYKKQGEAPLPIKWLALESLSDHVFSTYTDVWSFGIVLWEFFSLAKVPYPGMDPNQSLYLKLKDGYRMEKPPFANDELYDIMLECWSTNPESRPRFNELERKFARLLGDEVTNHYVDLNEPYLRINTEYMQRNQTDYLALMGSPDDMAPPPPRYVNGHILPEIRIDPSSSDDYLQMSTNSGTAIFSPTRPKDNDISADDPNITTTTTTSFTFPGEVAQKHSPTLSNNLDSPMSKTRIKDDIQPEEIPMLHSANHGSDGEPSPEQTRKFTTPTPSPRHQVIETQLSSNDNYVNVKSPKKLMNNNGSSSRTAPDAFSNPSYHMLRTVKEDGGGGKK